MQRQKDLIEEEAKRLKEESACPPGTVKLTEDERLAIIRQLEARKTVAEGELNRLPMRVDSLRVKNRQQELIDEIASIERSIAKFKRPVVYLEKGALAAFKSS